MSEQGTGGARENRAVIFGEGRIPGAKTFVLMEFEGREACVARVYSLLFHPIFHLSLPLGSRSFAVKRQLSYFIAAFAVLFQKIYIYIARINEKRKEGERDRIK